jgi:hypothetical protein
MSNVKLQTNVLQKQCKYKKRPDNGYRKDISKVVKYAVNAPVRHIKHRAGPKHSLKVGLINCQSLRNKTTAVRQHVLDNKLDVLLLTETWLKPHDDTVIINETTPTGYFSIREDRKKKRGGGLAILATKSLIKSSDVIKFPPCSSFEMLPLSVTKPVTMLFIVVYRPPGTACQFLTDFRMLLEALTLIKCDVIIAGDFNIHVDSPSDPWARSLNDLLESHGWKQLIHQPTHTGNHTLDLLIIRTDAIMQIPTISVLVSEGVSDHFAISFVADVLKPRRPILLINSRSFKNLNVKNFNDELDALLSYLPADTCPEMLACHYNISCASLLDKLAPLKKKSFILREDSAWFTDTLRQAKRRCRHLETKWRKTRTDINRLAYTSSRKQYFDDLHAAKSASIQAEIRKTKDKPKKLWQVLSSISGDSLKLSRKNANADFVLPQEGAAESFNCFFTTKIENILKSIPDVTTVHSDELDEKFDTILPLLELTEPTVDEIRHVISSLPSKSSLQDPLPTWLVKSDIRVHASYFWKLATSSFSSGVFPDSFKSALVTPVLKKNDLDCNVQLNYRPISNLSFTSKVLERLAARRLSKHLESSCVLDAFQSAYRSNYSTETAIARVLSDLAGALDDSHSVILVALDLSAAFDTVCHDALLTRLSNAAIGGTALQWFSSYLADRRQAVSFHGERSSPISNPHGVPQGSVLGPILFNTYMAPLGRYLTRNSINHHIYADDILVYMVLTGNATNDQTTVSNYQTALDRIIDWMRQQKLVVNPSKTQCLLLRNKRSMVPPLPQIRIAGETIKIQTDGSMRYLGIQIDAHLLFNSHVTNVCRSAFYHLRMIRHIRRSLNKDTATILCNSLVLSRIDYCGMLFHTLHVQEQDRLQRVINLAARVIFCATRTCHVSPFLKQLGWLRIRERSTYRALCMVHKVMYGSAPSYLKLNLRWYKPSRPLRSAEKHLIERVRSTRDIGNKMFAVFGSQLWNMLPENIRTETKRSSFEEALHSYLLTKCSET